MRDFKTLPLTNVVNYGSMIEALKGRPAGTPGLAIFAGPSGYGKTCASRWAAQNSSCIYVEVGFSWTRKDLLSNIFRQVACQEPKGSTSVLMQYINYELTKLGGEIPLMIDEADQLLRGNKIEIVREIHDKTGCPIVMNGEEDFPFAIKKMERVDNRIYRTVLAEPASIQDIATCAECFAQGVEISEDLIEAVAESCDGRIRRAVVTLTKIKEFAQLNGLERVDSEQFGSDNFFTGKVPSRVKAVKTARVA